MLCMQFKRLRSKAGIGFIIFLLACLIAADTFYLVYSNKQLLSQQYPSSSSSILLLSPFLNSNSTEDLHILNQNPAPTLLDNNVSVEGEEGRNPNGIDQQQQEEEIEEFPKQFSPLLSNEESKYSSNNIDIVLDGVEVIGNEELLNKLIPRAFQNKYILEDSNDINIRNYNNNHNNNENNGNNSNNESEGNNNNNNNNNRRSEGDSRDGLAFLNSQTLPSLFQRLDQKLNELANLQRLSNGLRGKLSRLSPYARLYSNYVQNEDAVRAELRTRMNAAVRKIEDSRLEFTERYNNKISKSWGVVETDLKLRSLGDTELQSTITEEKCPKALLTTLDDLKDQYADFCFEYKKLNTFRFGVNDAHGKPSCKQSLLTLSSSSSSSSSSSISTSSISTSSSKKKQKAFMVIGVLSSPKNFYRRQQIRATWKREASELGIPVRFVFMSTEINGAVAFENKIFDDFLILPGAATYDSLIRKTYGIGLWASEMFHYRYLLKTDDDAFVNIPEVVRHLTLYGKLNNMFMGFEYPNNFINLGKGPTGNLPFADHLGIRKYPLYMSGAGFIFSSDVIASFVAAQNYVPFMYFPREDATTGAWLLSQQVSKLHSFRFQPLFKSFESCRVFLTHHLPANFHETSNFIIRRMQCSLEDEGGE